MQRGEMTTAFPQRLGDPGYRLDGENPATATLDQAHRWVTTYDELIRFKRLLIGLCHQQAERAEPEVARAAEMKGGRSRGPD